jgi:hypothetical protein
MSVTVAAGCTAALATQGTTKVGVWGLGFRVYNLGFRF